jgi:hypothetical protein
LVVGVEWGAITLKDFGRGRAASNAVKEVVHVGILGIRGERREQEAGDRDSWQRKRDRCARCGATSVSFEM